MALNFQTSTLSLTLPISCQICLGKVRQPVICGNHHVFCSSCMEMWLKKASQCPSCRVSITTENPCREIIGGTNENDLTESPSVRKCLRKTRGELLLREYEEEIEGLLRENEELKTKNQSLELQLRTALDPCAISSVQADDKRVDPSFMEELAKRLQTAQNVCDEVKQDMNKLKEANKALRSQNVDLVQENMRLKSEVVSRSPQKFGRYTVAALEAKIQQSQRDVDHLKRALERSDQYIDDLENRVRVSEKRCAELQESCKTSTPEFESLSQQQKIHMMMRSLSDNERGSICSNPEADAPVVSKTHSLMFLSCADEKDSPQNPCGLPKKGEDLDGTSLGLDGTSSDLLPSTPSSAFRSLTLRSPRVREKKVAFKPVTHLRRIDFDDVPSPVNTATEDQFSFTLPRNSDDMEPLKPVFWESWKFSKSNDLSSPGPSKEFLPTDSVVDTFVADEPDSFQKSSEASMDAAFLNKISELDSMMLDVESSSSRGSQLSPASSLPADLDHTLVPEPHACSGVVAQCGTANNEASGGCAGEGRPPSLVCDVDESSVDHGGTSHAEELSFDLLFDAVEDTTAGPSGSVSPAGRRHDGDTSSPPCGKPVNTSRDRHTYNTGQPTKRKSHSPFNPSSPTKLSKLM